MSSPEPVQVLEQANAQRAQAKFATFDAMKAKKPRTSKMQVTLSEGEEPVLFEFKAIRPSAFDDMVTAHPPTEKQKVDNPQSNVNKDTFPPALLEAVCVEPKLTLEQWKEIWDDDSGAWSTAEKNSLYWEANAVCNAPLDLRPFASG